MPWNVRPQEHGHCTKIHIYTDGSEMEHTSVHTAAWSFVLVAQVWELHIMVGYFCDVINIADVGRGLTSADSNGAEAIAVWNALRWCAQCTFCANFAIYSDSKLVVDEVNGEADWHDAPKATFLTRGLRRALHHIAVSLEHIPGHQQHPWNEAADSAAKACARGHINAAVPMHIDERWISNDRPAHWAWLFTMSPFFKDKLGLPHTAGSKLLLTEPHWETSLPKAKLDFALFDESPTVDGIANLNLATFNAQSLGDAAKPLTSTAGRVESYRHQFHDRSIHLIGLQEARSRDSAVMLSATHIRIAGGPCQSRFGDCELWASASLPFIRCGESGICAQEHNFQVLATGHKYLLVAFKLQHLVFDILVAHGPNSQWGADGDVEPLSRLLRTGRTWNPSSRIAHSRITRL